MAGQGGKKIKINYSSVHEEFGVFGEARKCKVCKFVIAGKSSTNLKSHLKAKHADAYERVQSRFSISKEVL